MNLSVLVLYCLQGKGNASAPGSCRSIKLLEYAMIVLDMVIERRVRNILKIDGGNNDIFIVRQPQKKYI